MFNHATVFILLHVMCLLSGATMTQAANENFAPENHNGWWTWYIGDYIDYLQCDAIIKAGRPIPSQEFWVTLRQTYRQVVGMENSTISTRNDVNGFDGIPVHAAQAPDDNKGRGLFAFQTIKKGTRVFAGHAQCACFHDGYTFRRFLANIISLDVGMACDVLQWSLVQSVGKDYALCTNLDEGALMNTAMYVDVQPNVGCMPEEATKYKGGCEENDFALRDIRAGEELLCDYADFVVPGGWKKFGL